MPRLRRWVSGGAGVGELRSQKAGPRLRRAGLPAAGRPALRMARRKNCSAACDSRDLQTAGAASSAPTERGDLRRERCSMTGARDADCLVRGALVPRLRRWVRGGMGVREQWRLRSQKSGPSPPSAKGAAGFGMTMWAWHRDGRCVRDERCRCWPAGLRWNGSRG